MDRVSHVTAKSQKKKKKLWALKESENCDNSSTVWYSERKCRLQNRKRARLTRAIPL